MVLPIGDDNSGRQTTPVVNYLLIAANIIVFVFFQGLGSNDRFTYAWATVPAEIVTGRDAHDARPRGARRADRPAHADSGVAADAGQRLPDAADLDVHARRLHAPVRQHALPLDFRRQPGGSAAGLARARLLDRGPEPERVGDARAEFGRVGRHLGRARRLHPALPAQPRQRLLPYVITQVPAFVALGLWFIYQFISGLGLLGGGAQEGGVAYAAHTGGFSAGLVLVKLFAAGRPAPARY